MKVHAPYKNLLPISFHQLNLKKKKQFVFVDPIEGLVFNELHLYIQYLCMLAGTIQMQIVGPRCSTYPSSILVSSIFPLGYHKAKFPLLAQNMETLDFEAVDQCNFEIAALCPGHIDGSSLTIASNLKILHLLNIIKIRVLGQMTKSHQKRFFF